MRPVGPKPAAVLPYLEVIAASGTFSNYGPQVQALEERYAEHFGTEPRRVVVTSSATVALIAATSALKSEEWLVPSWTFTATAAAVRFGGAIPRFVDLEPDSHWADFGSSGNQSAAVVVTAPFGLKPPSKILERVAPTVIDAAASMGSIPLDLGSISPMTIVVFSLHATKILGAGEGGLVVCGSDAAAQAVREFINFGFIGSRDTVRTGLNGKMSEYAAAFAHAALDGWGDERREWIAARDEVRAISSLFGLQSLEQEGDFCSPYWIVDFDSEAVRRGVEVGLLERGIQTRRWWGKGCHTMPAYKDFVTTALPHTDFRAATCLGLPFYRGFGAKESLAISKALDEVLDGLTN